MGRSFHHDRSTPQLLGSELPITFVVAVNNLEVLKRNLLASPCLQGETGHQILVQENYGSAAAAYNEGLRKAVNNVVVFLHQDLFLPRAWLAQLEKGLRQLEEMDSSWGVAGCWGARADGQLCGHIYSSGLGVLGREFECPIPVQTLDEIVLVLRKDSGLRFDDALPNFHLYGTDICMRAAIRGQRNYVISAFCIHNTRQLLALPEEFYGCYACIKRAWEKYLPIQTTCIKVSRFDADIHLRNAKELLRRVVPRKRRRPAERVSDPERILRTLREAAEIEGTH